MSILPADFLQLSKDLIQNTNEEAKIRASANRAYYAAFHAAHRIAPSANGYKPPQKRSCLGHTELFNLLRNHEKNTPPCNRNGIDKEIIKIGFVLSQCFDLRVKADYKVHNPFSYLQAQDTIKQAEKIFQRLNRIP